VTTKLESFLVNPDEVGLRLDQLVLKRFPELTRRIVKELFAEGRIELDGRMAQKGERVVLGQTLNVTLPPADQAPPNPGLELKIAAESADWVIVEKPAGMPCAARRGDDASSTASALVARYPEMASFGHHPREAGLIHRLDNDTSGLLLSAKHAAAFAELSQALRNSQLHKRYLAIVESIAEEQGEIALALEADPRHKRRVRALPEAVAERNALRVTRYQVVARAEQRVLLELSLDAAYRHQIRAHLAAIGSPIIGDRLYGSSVPFPRHALHASELRYAGGAAALAFDIKSPLPADLRRCFEGALALDGSDSS
jgi:23S rRNA pseudouridine1911/1915/1917 synthase